MCYMFDLCGAHVLHVRTLCYMCNIRGVTCVTCVVLGVTCVIS